MLHGSSGQSAPKLGWAFSFRDGERRAHDPFCEIVGFLVRIAAKSLFERGMRDAALLPFRAANKLISTKMMTSGCDRPTFRDHFGKRFGASLVIATFFAKRLRPAAHEAHSLYRLAGLHFTSLVGRVSAVRL